MPRYPEVDRFDPVAVEDAVLARWHAEDTFRQSLAMRAGAPSAYLVDDASQVDWSWFDGVNTVGVTAGASAPEPLIQALVDAIRARFDAAVTEDDGARETVTFKLPRLRVIGPNLVVAFLCGDQFTGTVEPGTIAILQPVNATDDRCQQQQPGADEQCNPERRIFFLALIIFGGFEPGKTVFLIQVQTVAGGI